MIDREIFKPLVPGIPKVGDFYIASFSTLVHGGECVIPARVSKVEKETFDFDGFMSSGTHHYGGSRGVLIREEEGHPVIYVEPSFLEELSHVNGFKIK
ncbi:MAG: hypothetical protein Q7S56_01500 [Nanoarchaeota archaeon]|nr:hypothetical protein [Nanoarchaeota archaeon]